MQKLAQPTKIEKWAVVNFNARCDVQSLVQNLIKCGEMKGIVSCCVVKISEADNGMIDCCVIYM